MTFIHVLGSLSVFVSVLGLITAVCVAANRQHLEKREQGS
jgi:hypothetical protein